MRGNPDSGDFRTGISPSACTSFILALLLLTAGASAQDQLLSWGLSGTAPVEAPYPRFELEYVRPQIHRWYEPRNLFESYTRPWYIENQSAAIDYYGRYVNRVLEGDEWYDTFGRHIGRGWLVYDWQHRQPERNGSSIFKDPGSYYGFFQGLVVASDTDGRGSYRLAIGDAIDTRFTPLTFFKPRFNGIRLDHATDRVASTLIFSRPSYLSAERVDRLNQTNATHHLGGHTSIQVAPRTRLGFTYVNAHNVLTQRDFSFGNPLHGELTTEQDHPLEKLWVRLRDDSPAAGDGGATLLDHEIVLIDTTGRRLIGSEIGLVPRIEGGRQNEGALVVEGAETLLLEYDLLTSEAVDSGAIQRAWVELTVANDYRVEIASNLQTDGQTRNPEIVFLTAARAAGNVADDSNGRVLRLDYGLPTGSELIGIDWDLVDWHGLSLQGEAVLNRRFRRYPGPSASRHPLSVDRAHAAYLQAAFDRTSWSLFAEAFSIADDYSTSYWLTKGGGQIIYKAAIPQLYEFVEDDDDHDGTPEWERPYHASSAGVAWPGYDENRDFIHDYNQNANLIPDYEEPFIRFRSDRPEFLFGLDMNYNGTADRFENDLEPDYPYRRDHRGYNAYLRLRFGPSAGLVFGNQRLHLISGDGRTRAWYALFTWVRDTPLMGRMRLYDFAARVHDDIPDHLEQWVQPLDALGRMREIVDYLPARNTRKNTFYADLDQRFGAGIRLQHRCKWELLYQLDPDADLQPREGRRWSGFFGLIDKIEWSIPFRLGLIEPRWKSEYRRDRPYTTRQSRATSLEQTFSLLWTQPLLSESTSVSYFTRYGRQLFDTELQVGLEMGRFWMLEGTREEIDQDFATRTFILQLVNRVGYQGYRLVTRAGLQWNKRDLERDEDLRSSVLFVTVNAGLQ